MKWMKKVLNSQFLHRMGLIFTLVGVVWMGAAWLAEDGGSLWGFSQERLYLDAICFLLIAAGLRIGCLMHHWEERLGIRPNPYGYTVEPLDKAPLPPP
jgi:hypothetical protein